MDSADPQALEAQARELIRLRAEVAHLRQVIRAKDDFIAIAAHELRNPMTPILGTAQLALLAGRKAQANCPPRVIMLLERMHLAVQDFIERATRLLDVSRIEAGNLKLEPVAIDLSKLVRTVVQKYEVMALRNHSVLNQAIEDGATGTLDPLAVEQIVENLLSNALKFGTGKPVDIHLEVVGQSALIEVQDRGAGMPPDQQARIFGRFEQIVTQYEGSGFGIGLWVTSRLVAAMNGKIAVSSVLGEGSTFKVVLPLEFLPEDRTFE